MTGRIVTRFAALLLLATALVAGTGAANAGAEYVAANKHRVLPSTVEGTQMEVFSRPGAAGPQYFCAAGEYAARVLGAGNSDRVRVVLPEAPSQTKPGFRSVFFTVVPWQEGSGGNSSLTIDIRRPGEEMSVVLARKFCPPRFLRPF